MWRVLQRGRGFFLEIGVVVRLQRIITEPLRFCEDISGVFAPDLKRNGISRLSLMQISDL
jgi:hypothetical protein